MAIMEVEDIEIGQTIRFKTINPHDNVYHTGLVKGIVNYQIAKTFDDIQSYYTEVLRANSAIGDIDTLTYIIVAITENDSTVTTRVFAQEFIDESTLEVVELDEYVTIKVYDIGTSKAEDVLDAIRTLGYTCEIIDS